jgi:DnaD/phage-associated family protein
LFRGIFGIYSRNLSKTEKELFSKWSNDFGYFTEIVTEAYDIAVSKVEGRNALIPYADRLLTRWHECGCHTAEECRKQYEKDEEERRKNHEAEAPTSRKKREKTERYGNFNVEDAFLRALDRSYSEDSNN